MILSDKIGTSIRVSCIRSMTKPVYGKDSSSPQYCIESRYTNISGNYELEYGSDKDARDADFERLNSAMDALDGIQQ